MRILAVWDNKAEAELISTYLHVEENEVRMTTSPEGFRREIGSGRPTDIILMPIDLPDSDSAFELFSYARQVFPDAPIVGACSPSDVFRVVRFMAHGMSAYLSRDAGGDYMFLIQAVMKSTLDAVRAAREKELAQKLRVEIESVRKLQESVLPKNIVSPPGYRICARFDPAELRVVGGHPVAMAGGDYYDVFTLADKNMALLVGDATGHGMAACMSIMTMHTLVRMMRRQEYTDTAHFVTEINKGLCDQSIVNQKGRFITLLYAVLNPATRILQWSSAGHHPPLVQDLTTGSIEPLAGQNAGGLPLAIDEDSEYETYTCELPENCRLLLYTDGLEEAFPDNDESNHFGKDGIIRTLADTAQLSLDKTLARLFEDSDEFTRGSGRQDDTSVVLLEYRK